MPRAAHPASRFRGLHVLADDDPRWRRDPVEQAEAACAGGASVVQLRAKHALDREALGWAHAIRSLTRASGAAFVVNDRADLALLSGADAVHLGQDDLPPSAVRAVAQRSDRPALAIGRSTHTLEQARAACSEPIDYLAFGPVFGTRSKESGYAARGLVALREIVALAAALPVVAIGGIDAGNVAGIASSGAAGFAVISAAAAAEHPREAVSELVRGFALEEAT